MQHRDTFMLQMQEALNDALMRRDLLRIANISYLIAVADEPLLGQTETFGALPLATDKR